MKKFIEGSHAIAEAVRLCKPGVVSAYPITPQTHIVEALASFVANGKLDAQFINVESEHSAASVVLGSVATGVRAFTATSSQGLLLMNEVLYCIAGMRLPVVMACANRAISAPINIWNDHQDAISVRDCGFVQLFVENNQEAHDFIYQAYKLGENPKVMLPVMINIDGFILTHGVESVEIPEQKTVDNFLTPFKPPYKLDVNDPMSFGILGGPEVYLEHRFALHKTLEETIELIPQIGQEFKKCFGRQGIDLVEKYFVDDAETVIVAMGSVCGTIKDFIDKERDQGKNIGLLRIISYRPFPKNELITNLKNKNKIIVLEKAISLGSEGPLYTEVKSLLGEQNVSGFIAGLGGRDITLKTISKMIAIANEKTCRCKFLDINKNLLKDEFYV